MKLAFYKYQGTGNDFILIDNRSGEIRLSKEKINLLCDRHFGIGADGLMLLTSEPGYDFGMQYFNADGNESTMCGNGGRCITAFAKACNIITTHARFLAIDGAHTADILQEDGTVTQIKLKLSDVTSSKVSSLKSNIQNLTSKIQNPISRISHLASYPLPLTSHIINTGSPHFVLFVEDACAIDVVNDGRKIRNDQEFAPEGINVDFVQVMENGSLFVRTYERGVEDETLSCGTGVTAAALASGLRHPASEISIETRGGMLTVTFSRESDRFTDIWLTGPVGFVFKGEITV